MLLFGYIYSLLKMERSRLVVGDVVDSSLVAEAVGGAVPTK